MSAPLPPVPHKTMFLDERGLLTPVWSDWLEKLAARVGGTVASTPEEIEARFPVVAADIATDAVETAKIKALNVTTAKIAAEAVTFAKMLGTEWTKSFSFNTGYTKIANGMIFQWGSVSGITSGSTSSVVFDIAFPTSCHIVIASPAANSGVATTATGQVGSGNYSTSGMDLYNRTSVTQQINWLAVGY